MQELLNATSHQYWTFTDGIQSMEEVRILLPSSWNTSSCLAGRDLRSGHLTHQDILVLDSQPYTDDLPWSLQVRLQPSTYYNLLTWIFVRISGAATRERE